MQPLMSDQRTVNRSVLRVGYSCVVQLWGAVVGCSCGVQLWGAVVGSSCGVQLWGPVVGCSCGVQLWGTVVGYSCGVQLWGAVVGCSCGVQLWGTVVGYSCGVTCDVVRCGVVRICMTWIFSPLSLSLSLSHSGPCDSHDVAVAFLE